MSSPVNFIRSRPKYAAARFTLASSDLDLDVQTQLGIFASENPGSTHFDADRGFGNGVRCNIRIKPESNPVWVRFNSATNDIIFIAGDEIYEDFNIEVSNIFITSAAETTAQIDRIVFANDVSGSYNNTYVKTYAFNPATGASAVYGLWFNINSAGVQPVDSTVDTWLPVLGATNITGINLAAAAELVVDAVTGVFTSDDGTPGTLDITHSVAGPRHAAVDVGTPATVTTPTPGAGTDTNVNIRVV